MRGSMTWGLSLLAAMAAPVAAQDIPGLPSPPMQSPMLSMPAQEPMFPAPDHGMHGYQPSAPVFDNSPVLPAQATYAAAPQISQPIYAQPSGTFVTGPAGDYPGTIHQGYSLPGYYAPVAGSPYFYSAPGHVGRGPLPHGDPALAMGGGAGAGSPAGDPYQYHFGPGYYRSGEYGHIRFPYYSYRRPWFYPGFDGYNRDTNLPW